LAREGQRRLGLEQGGGQEKLNDHSFILRAQRVDEKMWRGTNAHEDFRKSKVSYEMLLLVLCCRTFKIVYCAA
jgi:hypothetical protein